MNEESNNLPVLESADELAWKELRQYLLDPREDYPEPYFMLEYNGVPFSTLGGIQAISGQKKNGKSFVLTQLMAAVLGIESERVKVMLPGLRVPERTVEYLGHLPRVLYVDTEMEKLNSAKVLRRVHWLCEWDMKQPNDRFSVLWLRTVEDDEEMKEKAYQKRFRLIQQGLELMKPDIVFMKYWTPFMAPCFGSIARLARSNRHTKVICQIDNVEPHEHHATDKPFNRYYLNSVDGFIYMSEQVHNELKVYTSAPALFSPHPMFENFGSRVEREEACKELALDPEVRYTMFFGLIRDYKGLDTLLEAWAKFRRAGHKLLIAGEFYASRERYMALIERLGLENDIVLHDYFIPDDRIKHYFSVADCVVLPYKTATQSGVTQICYNFCTPVIVTNVGGLAEIVPDDRVGYVCEPTIEGVTSALERIYEGNTLTRFAENMTEERKRFSWSAMCDAIEEVYDKIKSER